MRHLLNTSLTLILLLGIIGYAQISYAQEDDPLRAFLERVQQKESPDTGADTGAEGQPALPEVDTSPRSPDMALSPDSAGPVSPGTASPVAEEDIQDNIRKQAFDAALTGLLPLKPDEIRKLMEEYDKTRQAVEVPIYPYPEPEIAVKTVSLDPGSRPIVIKVSPNHVTTVTIVDSTGEPWPIQDLSWAGDFNILQPKAGENLFRITPMSDFTYGNMSMRLLELDTPVVFTLKTVRESVYYRLDVRIPELGPNADIPLIGGNITLVSGDSTISAFLDGVIPENATPLTVSGADGRTQAYKYNSMTYVRTPLTLLSPGWSGSVSSADGMNVYVLSNAPVLLLSDKGDVVRAHLNEKDGDDNE